MGRELFKKTYIKNILLVIIFFLFLTIICGCNSIDDYLNTPSNLNIDRYDILRWDEVPNASNYMVIISNSTEELAHYETSTNEIDLFEKVCDIGEYKIKVYAYDSKSFKESEYSDSIDYVILDQTMYFSFSESNNKQECSISISNENSKFLQGKLVIPEYSPNGLKITKISSINNTNIDTLFLPDTISQCDRIGYNNSLKRIRISNLMTTMCNIHHCNQLERIYIPSGINKMSHIICCENLKEIIVDEENPVYKSDHNYIIEKETNILFSGLGDYEIPSYVTEIGKFAFANSYIEEFIVPGNINIIDFGAFEETNKLRKLIIEEGVEELRDNVFVSSKIEELILPSSIKQIGEVFKDTFNLNKIEIHNNEFYKVEDNCLIEIQTNKLLYATKGAVIPDYVTILNSYSLINSSIVEISIPNNVIEIRDLAFYKGGIEKISLNNVKEIGHTVFSSCKNLIEVDLGNYLTIIPNYTFENCTSLTTVKMPQSITTIGYCAFRNCQNLKNIDLHEGITTIEGSSFEMCVSLQNIVIPKSVKQIFDWAFEKTFSSILLFDNTIETTGTPFGTCTVYTSINECDLEKVQLSNFIINVDISDNYVKSFIYVYNEKKTNDSIWLGGGMQIVENVFEYLYAPIFIPFKTGYKFLGFSLNENSREIILEPKEFEYLYEDKLIGFSFNKKCLAISKEDMINLQYKISNGTTLYAIWEKIE